ncbi:MAG: response regulator [Candidatus Thermoplasmatota archaeon]|jgi:CheY-like chemotaxis protein
MTSILVADDEADILESMQLVLTMEGFTVTTVLDAKRILPTLRKVRPDVLLQDINMPGLDPAKLIPEIRAEPSLKKMRVLVFTASVDSESICERLGADGYIQKPFDASRIKGAINRFLRNKKGT